MLLPDLHQAPAGIEAAARRAGAVRTGEQERSRRHAPDLFARRADGTAVVVDVRPDDRVPAKDAEVFAVTAQDRGTRCIAPELALFATLPRAAATAADYDDHC
jgi:hypothetical protein